MENYYFEQPKKKEPEKEPEKSFFQEIFTFTENGKLKSLDMIYALLLAFVFLFFYFGAQHFITLWFEDLFQGLGRTALNILDIALPAVLCTAVLCVIDLFIKNTRLFPMAFAFALLTELIVIVYILISFPADVRALILPAIIYMLLLPTLLGAAAILFETRLLRRKRQAKSASPRP